MLGRSKACLDGKCGMQRFHGSGSQVTALPWGLLSPDWSRVGIEELSSTKPGHCSFAWSLSTVPESIFGRTVAKPLDANEDEAARWAIFRIQGAFWGGRGGVEQFETST